MILHVVLFRPRPDLTQEHASALIATIERAAREIPVVRRFRVGRRVADAPAYSASGVPDFPFFALVEFDDRADLNAYLAHPAHVELGRHFNASLDGALVFDYEVAEANGSRRLLRLTEE